MKIIKIIGHPVSVMSMYLLLLISGQSFGGFYILYIFLGLPHGVPDAIVSTFGLGTMFLGYKIYRKEFNPVKPLLYIIGNAVMILGLILFFQNTKGYNDATFHQAFPLFTFAVFGICVLCNIFLSVRLFIHKSDNKGKDLHSVQGFL